MNSNVSLNIIALPCQTTPSPEKSTTAVRYRGFAVLLTVVVVHAPLYNEYGTVS